MYHDEKYLLNKVPARNSLQLSFLNVIVTKEEACQTIPGEPVETIGRVELCQEIYDMHLAGFFQKNETINSKHFEDQEKLPTLANRDGIFFHQSTRYKN